MFESLFLVLALLLQPAPVEDCFDDAFCVTPTEQADGVRLQIRSLLPGNISMRLELVLENLTADTPEPILFTLPGRGRLDVVTLRVEDPRQAWSYRYGVRWTAGTLRPPHDDAYLYRLPYADRDEYLVGQGYDGPNTHQGVNAIDFDMPEGTWVVAAREGIVVATENRYRDGRLDPALKLKSNHVSVQHDDGTVAEYVHLQPGGVFVEPGQTVHRGDRLGRSGHTGYASGPHLHFAVYGINAQLERETYPTRFQTSDGPQLLEFGRRYRH